MLVSNRTSVVTRERDRTKINSCSPRSFKQPSRPSTFTSIHFPPPFTTTFAIRNLTTFVAPGNLLYGQPHPTTQTISDPFTDATTMSSGSSLPPTKGDVEGKGKGKAAATEEPLDQSMDEDSDDDDEVRLS